MRIAIGCDHRGIELKQSVIGLITAVSHRYEDFGCDTADSVDYPDIAKEVSEAVAKGDFDYGILICSTGIGMCIVANKVKGIRAANCYNTFTARRARQHNNANVLCLSAEGNSTEIPAIVETFLNAEFEGGRHQRRLDKIRAIEERQ
jgi:ribose 5-phosphate isomerase B